MIPPTFAQAESFRAQVKVMLIDPASLPAEDQTHTLSIPLKELESGRCEINAKTGSLSGNACLGSEIETPTLDLSGRASQDISIKLETGHNAEDQEAATLSFKPTLYNGQNQNENFQLTTSHHSINIGGEITQHPKALATNTLAADSTNIHYGIEVLYP